MKLYFYRGTQNNFGDELNHWLMPKVFPGFFDEDESVLFLAIGSIILDSHPKDSLKVVFGSGYGGYTAAPVIDDRWKFYGVRGARTAEVCGLPPEQVVGDTAILINRFQPPARAKKYKFSFMPHWETADRVNWRRACKMAGVHLIDPRESVDAVLEQLLETEVMITEAMHGAIVADALRVPWIPILPLIPKHRDKWHDWASALDLRLEPVELATTASLRAQYGQGGPGAMQHLARTGWLGERVAHFVMSLTAARALRKAAASTPQRSTDAALERSVRKLEAAADRIKRDFARTPRPDPAPAVG